LKAQLTSHSINQAVKEAEEYLDQKKTDSKDLIRIKLGIEETLLFYQRELGENAWFSMDKGTLLGRRKIRLSIRGTMQNPQTASGFNTDEDKFMHMSLLRMGKLPKWSYGRGTNVIIFQPKRKRLPDWQSLLIAIVAAVLCRVLMAFLPESVRSALLSSVAAPLLDCFLGFLNAVAGPMIFLSVVWGIYSIGDTSTFSIMGKKLGARFTVYVCLITILMAVLCLPFSGIDSDSIQGGSQLSALFQMILNIIPRNLFTPFSEGNTLQILFEATIIGITMLLIGKETHVVANLSEELGYIVNGIMGVISRLVPIFVFASLTNILAESDTGSIIEGGVFFFSTFFGCIGVMLIHTACACIRLKISPVTLWKKTFSTFVISITTASSAAAFSDNIKTCTDDLGVSRMLANFGVPFGQILYKPGVSVLFLFAAMGVAINDNAQINMVWIITAVLVCIILSAAAPPVPGGMSASFTILFSQLGLPLEKLAVIISLTAILDFVVTATNIFSEQCILAIVNKEIDYSLIEDSSLRSE